MLTFACVILQASLAFAWDTVPFSAIIMAKHHMLNLLQNVNCPLELHVDLPSFTASVDCGHLTAPP